MRWVAPLLLGSWLLSGCGSLGNGEQRTACLEQGGTWQDGACLMPELPTCGADADGIIQCGIGDEADTVPGFLPQLAGPQAPGSASGDESGMPGEAALCYVGKKEEGDETDLVVACNTSEGTGPELLAEFGFGNVVFGPASWESCGDYMREQGVPGWEEIP